MEKPASSKLRTLVLALAFFALFLASALILARPLSKSTVQPGALIAAALGVCIGVWGFVFMLNRHLLTHVPGRIIRIVVVAICTFVGAGFCIYVVPHIIVATGLTDSPEEKEIKLESKNRKLEENRQEELSQLMNDLEKSGEQSDSGKSK